MPQGAVKPSNWNEDHEADGLLGALILLGLQSSAIPYLDADQHGGMIPVSDFVRNALMSIADAPALRALLNAANLDSPSFAGSPSAPTQSAGDNSTRLATTAYADRAVATLIASAPAALDTLNELAAALGNDANFAATVTNALALKAALNSPAFTGGPTAPTQTAGDSSTKLSTTAFVAAAIAALANVARTGAYADLSGKPTLGTAAALNVGAAAGNVVQLDGGAKLPAIDGSQLTGIGTNAVPLRNRLLNGGFAINQRAVGGAVASGAYALDGNYVLAETGNVTVAQTSGAAIGDTGAHLGIKLTQPDATAKRIGLAMPVEWFDCADLTSLAASISGRVRLSTAQPIRFALLESTASADGFTRAFVNNWASTNYSAGNFFNATTKVIAVGSVTPGAAVWGSFSASGTFDASLQNAILFVWSEAALATGATLELNRCKMEAGAVATPFAYESNAEARVRCQRWYETFAANWSGISGAQVNRSFSESYPFKVTKRTIVPAVLSGVGGIRVSGVVVNSTNANGCVIAWNNTNNDGDDFGWSATVTVDASIGV
jgi:hypothetical protein